MLIHNQWAKYLSVKLVWQQRVTIIGIMDLATKTIDRMNSHRRVSHSSSPEFNGVALVSTSLPTMMGLIHWKIRPSRITVDRSIPMDPSFELSSGSSQYKLSLIEAWSLQVYGCLTLLLLYQSKRLVAWLLRSYQLLPLPSCKATPLPIPLLPTLESISSSVLYQRIESGFPSFLHAKWHCFESTLISSCLISTNRTRLSLLNLKSENGTWTTIESLSGQPLQLW